MESKHIIILSCWFKIYQNNIVSDEFRGLFFCCYFYYPFMIYVRFLSTYTHTWAVVYMYIIFFIYFLFWGFVILYTCMYTYCYNVCVVCISIKAHTSSSIHYVYLYYIFHTRLFPCGNKKNDIITIIITLCGIHDIPAERSATFYFP